MAKTLNWEKIKKIRQRAEKGIKKTRIAEDFPVSYRTVCKYTNMEEEELQEIKERQEQEEERKAEIEEELERREKEFEELKDRYVFLNYLARYEDPAPAFDKADIFETDKRGKVIDELKEEGLLADISGDLTITGDGWKKACKLLQKGGEEIRIVEEPAEIRTEELLPEERREENKEEIKEELELGEKAREIKEKVKTKFDKDLNNEEFKELLEKAFLFYIPLGNRGKELAERIKEARKLKKKYSKKAREERKKRQANEILKTCWLLGKNPPKKIVNRAAAYF